MAQTISLSRGLFALVSDEDYAVLAAVKWHAVSGGATFYAGRNITTSGGRQRQVTMHRMLLGAGPGQIVDHINGDGLDNRRENLRLCCHAENLRNQRARTGCSSRFKGVRATSNGKRWYAEIEHNGDKLFLGSFEEEVRAARQYDRTARLLFGRFARTNASLGLLPSDGQVKQC